MEKVERIMGLKQRKDTVKVPGEDVFFNGGYAMNAHQEGARGRT